MTALPDLLGPDTDVLLVGTAVGKLSHERRHYYSHPTNRFWSLLRSTGLTHGADLGPDNDGLLPQYGIGLTDLAKERAASSDRDLVRTDLDVDGFLAKIEHFRPAVVGFNGKEVASILIRALGGGSVGLGELKVVGFEPDVFVLPSSSGSNTSMSFAQKREVWRRFGLWVSETSAGGRAP